MNMNECTYELSESLNGKRTETNALKIQYNISRVKLTIITYDEYRVLPTFANNKYMN